MLDKALDGMLKFVDDLFSKGTLSLIMWGFVLLILYILYKIFFK